MMPLGVSTLSHKHGFRLTKKRGSPTPLLHLRHIFFLLFLFLQIKLNALRQRQLIRVIDRIGLPAHISLPGIGAALTAAARFFFPAKRTAYLSTRSTDVHVGNAAV